jgi:hypothetical protein
MSIRTRLAFGVLVPLGLAVTSLGLAWVPIVTGSTHLQATALLSGALMFMAIGTGLAMLERNAQALTLPLEEACAAANALLQGQNDRRIRITRMDETGDVLVALHELGNYLAVMLPEEDENEIPYHQPGRPVVAAAPRVTLERIVEQLREGEQEYTPEASAPAARTVQRPRLVSSNQA